MDEKLARLTDEELSDSEILKNNGVEIVVERQNSRQPEKDVPENDDDEEEDDDDLPTGMEHCLGHGGGGGGGGARSPLPPKKTTLENHGNLGNARKNQENLSRFIKHQPRTPIIFTDLVIKDICV